MWPWRAAGFVASTPPVAAAAVPLLLLGLPWLALLARVGRQHSLRDLLLVPVGAVLVGALGPLLALPLAEVERARLRMVDVDPVRSGHRRPAAPGPLAWLRTRYAEPETWRELSYALLLVTAAPVLYGGLFLVLLLVCVWIASPALVGGGPVSLGPGTARTLREAVPYALAGAALLPATPYLVGLVAGVHGAVARGLLRAVDEPALRTELVEVARSRARLVDAFEVERHRIERDLHDGAQQRLVSLTLQLGLARLDLADDSPAGAAVADAHQQAKDLMAELRELIHGIHPRVLTDLGLPDALRELADHAPIPVTVRTDLPTRPPPHLEGTVYFVVAEALTNVVKHSGAAAAAVTVFARAGTLAVEVRDDGGGGADPALGSGLTGLADRIAVVDGRMLLSSPAGGPTRLRVEIPWAAP
jgi:signal transduction histidine kinase